MVELGLVGVSRAPRLPRSFRRSSRSPLGETGARIRSCASCAPRWPAPDSPRPLCSLTFDSLSFPMFVNVYALVIGLIGACWRLAAAERQQESGPSRVARLATARTGFIRPAGRVYGGPNHEPVLIGRKSGSTSSSRCRSSRSSSPARTTWSRSRRRRTSRSATYILVNPPPPPTEARSLRPGSVASRRQPVPRFSDQTVLVQVLAEQAEQRAGPRDASPSGADPNYTALAEPRVRLQRADPPDHGHRHDRRGRDPDSQLVGAAMTRELDRMQEIRGVDKPYRIRAEAVVGAHDAKLEGVGQDARAGRRVRAGHDPDVRPSSSDPRRVRSAPAFASVRRDLTVRRRAIEAARSGSVAGHRARVASSRASRAAARSGPLARRRARGRRDVRRRPPHLV